MVPPLRFLRNAVLAKNLFIEIQSVSKRSKQFEKNVSNLESMEVLVKTLF